MKADDPAQRLREAAKKGDIGGIRAALAAGASLDGPRKGVVTPLMIAAEKGHTLAVLYLLDAGANPNLATRQGYTALDKAIDKRSLDVIKLLLGRGANPNGTGYTTLPIQDISNSVEEGADEITRLLLEHGAPVLTPDWSGLLESVDSIDAEVAALFLAHGASPDERPQGALYIIKDKNGISSEIYMSPREMLQRLLGEESPVQLDASETRELRKIEQLFREWDAKQASRS
jgi:ankyrin repeat protein